MIELSVFGVAGIAFLMAAISLICSRENRNHTKRVEKELRDNHKEMLYRTCPEHKWGYVNFEYWYGHRCYNFKCKKCGYEAYYWKSALPLAQLRALQDLGIIKKPAKEKKKAEGKK